MTAIAIVFWVAAGLIVYAHLGYPLVLALIRGVRRPRPAPALPAASTLPRVALVIAAYDEEQVIAEKIANALALDYPRDRLQIVVASDGSTDRTVALATEAGADLVLELPRGGKVAALNASARATDGEILAFSDANSFWSSDALRLLMARFVSDPGTGYVCGQVRFSDPGGAGNQEGAYWRYEMAIRSMESDLAGVTAGNGAIYAVRRDAFIEIDPGRGHDLSLPFELTKRGWRASYAPEAVAEEKMAPTIEGEFKRKRRMMWGVWDALIGWGMLNPRGYPPAYMFEIVSHRFLRYLTPWLHLVALGTNVALLGEGAIYAVTLAAQLSLLAAGLLGRFVNIRPLRIAYYYLTVTSSIAVGAWDRVRAGQVPIGWEKVEGTR